MVSFSFLSILSLAKAGLFCYPGSTLRIQNSAVFLSLMRGQQSLYNSLFPQAVLSELKNKSKRNVYLVERDDKLACRYYFHANIRRARYDDCLVELSAEFDLTHNVIMQRLQLRLDFLKKLVKDQTPLTVLKKKYPFYNWNVNYKLAV